MIWQYCSLLFPKPIRTMYVWSLLFTSYSASLGQSYLGRSLKAAPHMLARSGEGQAQSIHTYKTQSWSHPQPHSKIHIHPAVLFSDAGLVSWFCLREKHGLLQALWAGCQGQTISTEWAWGVLWRAQQQASALTGPFSRMGALKIWR